MPGEIYALFGAMLFGCGHIAVRKAHDEGWSNHNVLISVAIVNALCYLVGFGYLSLTAQLPEIRNEALAWFAVAGVLTALLGRSTLWASIERIGAARAASYRVTSPVVTVAMAYLLLNERLSAGALVGAMVAILGLWLLTAETSSRTTVRAAKGRRNPAVSVGIALGIASAAFFGAGQVYRKLGLEFTPLPILGSLVGTSTALLVFASTAMRGGRWREMLVAHRQRFGWPILVAGLLTAAAQYSIFYSYERARVSTASVLGATEPVWTLLAASLFMRRQEAPSWRLALSIVVICAGSALVVSGG